MPASYRARCIAMVELTCRLLALLGGLILLCLAVLTVVSVLGRYLFNRPITGDFELVEMGCAIAVATFLPYAQLRKGNVIVDVATTGLPVVFKRALDALGCLLLAVIAGLFTWRLTIGGMEFARYNDETMVLHLNTWWGFAVLVPCMALLTLVSLVTVARALTGTHGQTALKH